MYLSTRCTVLAPSRSHTSGVLDISITSATPTQNGDRGMAIAGSHVSMMEKPCSWFTTPSELATFLYTRNTRKGRTGRLACLASHR